MSMPPPPGPLPPERPFDPHPPSGERPVQSPFSNPAPAPYQPPAQFGPPQNPVPRHDPYGRQNPYGQQNSYGQQTYQPVPPGYQHFGQGAVAAPTRTNGLAVASMVLGIVGIVLFCLYAIPSILAVIFGAVSLSQFKTQPTVYTGRGMAVAGLVLGLVGVSLLVLLLAIGSSWLTIN